MDSVPVARQRTPKISPKGQQSYAFNGMQLVPAAAQYVAGAVIVGPASMEALDTVAVKRDAAHFARPLEVRRAQVPAYQQVHSLKASVDPKQPTFQTRFFSVPQLLTW